MPGASNDAFAILQQQHKDDLDEITNAGPYFWRDKSRKAPHNLYSNLEKLLEGAEKRNTRSRIPRFQPILSVIQMIREKVIRQHP
ncbi:DUF3048 domain-containing protein [Paenibacillus sp. D2_2]|uniref:DUF3048 domain-containing protein n=1 Tax=Paenibacillus sp. D2_2 TaxID=3073092 RepID=UPI0028153747|nr:DUF3048 domain-containing protein [Paenibacillus sp. D2_2]WMT41730.1 DUF3048 domain-containing protein [Paenibacillus sp. D2_2]